MRSVTIVAALTAVACLVVPAGAHWNEGDPYKWLQPPDLSENGLDVFASSPKILADDFLCTSPDYITDIHIWGSWKNDILPGGNCDPPVADPSSVNFHLSIHADIPVDEPAIPYSRPGEQLWQANVPARLMDVRVWQENLEEGWYNPNTGEYLPVGDTVCYQYNFILTDYLNDPEVEAILPDGIFQQNGTEQDPVVYWLDVQATPIDPETGLEDPAEFGWKTSYEHWNDDAVWSDCGTQWNELRYPDTHPLQGDSIDLSFVITPEPATMTLLAIGAVALLRRRSR